MSELIFAKYSRSHVKYKQGYSNPYQAAVDYRLADGSEGHVKLEWQDERQRWQCENSADLLGSSCPVLSAINQALASKGVTKSVHPHRAHQTIIDKTAPF